MLITLRRLFVDSWLGRIIAVAIFVAFVGWGGDTLLTASNNDNSVLRVGDRQVTPRQLSEAVATELSWIQSQGGDKALEQFKQLASQEVLGQGALHNLATADAVAEFQEAHNFEVGDQIVRDRVFSDPQFKGANGQYDPKKLDELLNANHLTRQDLVTRMLVAAQMQAGLLGMGDGVRYYAPFLKLLTEYSTRVYPIDIVRVSYKKDVKIAFKDFPIAEQKRFYDNHPDLFQAPSERSVSIVAVTEDSVAQGAKVPEETLKKLYELRLRDYDVPETRSVLVVTSPDQAELSKIAARLKSGAKPAALEKEFPNAVFAQTNRLRHDDFPDNALADLVFATAQNQISQPKNLAAGWTIVQVEQIVAPEKKSFDQVKDSLRAEIVRTEQSDLMQAQRSSLRDLVARSADLAHLDNASGYSIWKGVLKDSDLYPSGMPAVMLKDQALLDKILQVAQKAQENAPPVLTNLPNGEAFALTVDKITPAVRESFEVAQPEILAEMNKRAQRRELETATVAVLQAHKEGKKDAVKLPQNIVAQEWNGDLSRALPAPAEYQALWPRFAATAEDAKSPRNVMIEGGDDYLVVSYGAPHAAAEEVVSKQRASLGSALGESMSADASELLGSGYVASVKVAGFNRPLFQQVLSDAVKQR